MVPRDVGPPATWDGPVAFLDGTQHVDLVGYAGTLPIVGAEVAAAVRQRDERELRTVAERHRSLVIGRASALAQLPALSAERIELEADATVPPLRDLTLASAEAAHAREALEIGVGLAYRERSSAWLVVDGSLGASAAWLRDGRMVGLSRSHAVLPFEGTDLDAYLRLPPGHRTPAFAPPARHGIEYRAWAVRLWPWEGKDLLHGLVRVEVSAANGTTGMADQLTRWLLAERSPIAGTESRWDTLIYPLHAVREYLRARG